MEIYDVSVLKFGKDLPTFVKKFREEMEWSQTDLAHFMGIHGQYVSNVERRKSKSFIAFASRLLPLVGRDRKPYLMDLIAEEASNRAVHKLKSATRQKAKAR